MIYGREAPGSEESFGPGVADIASEPDSCVAVSVIPLAPTGKSFKLSLGTQ